MAPTAITKGDLLTRLAEGHAARLTVVTPNARLARELAREFDAGQAAKGLAVWETADILPLPSLVERLYEDALYSALAAKLPLLLTDAQAQSLWEAAIRESRWGETLLAVPQAAGEAARAWALAQGWRIDGALASFPGNDDARAFADWAKDYARRSSKAGATDRARLADVVAPLLKEETLRKPALLVLYAFDELKPQDRDFLDACAKADIELRACAPGRRGGKAAKHVFPSAREELDAAAQWSRARLEAGASRIGVVVPQLGERRKEVARVFARTMHPGHNLPGAEDKALPFNISLGAPLDDYPIVRAALSILELSSGEIPFEQASRLIRSPFIAGASPEMAPRALLDARLRRSAPAKLGLGKLIALVEGAPVLRQSLEKLFSIPRQENVSPHDWARHFTAILEAMGFPGDRTLDSAEHQARAKLNECFAELAKLERVAPKMSPGRALASLRRLCGETLFQPESPDAPIQVLGVLESLGLEFDALWVSGLTDEAWPLHTRANPFIPPALQRKAGIREASPEATLEWAKKVTEGWVGAANEVVLSHPAREDDRELLASPLISGVSSLSETPETKSVARYRDLIFAKRVVERVADGRAPALTTRTPKGGTRILADQAACPFRAFARHRLNAEALEEPVEGLDARARGLLLHTLMKELWTELKGSEGLANAEPAIGKAAKAAVAEAGLEEPFASLERARLEKLAREWL
ncbi:MAG: PD-(D/E)XK nuclease family protein, partial [Burkholderiales bacterium]